MEPTAENGLREISYVQCELIRSVGRRRLVHPLGTIDVEAARAVDGVARILLGH